MSADDRCPPTEHDFYQGSCRDCGICQPGTHDFGSGFRCSTCEFTVPGGTQ